MGFWDIVKDQFLDVIEFEDKSNKLVVTKFRRESGNNELKQGSKVIVRESQCAVFLKGGQLADVLLPGTYSLNTENFPILTKLEAFPYLFVSPVIADLYFVSTRQFIDNKWATKNPIMKRDKDFSMARIRAFGKFAFRISDVALFMREIFGTKGIVMTYDIVEYLSSMVTEIFSTVVGESTLSVLDLAAGYRNLSVAMQEKLNEQTKVIGILFSDVVIESISLVLRLNPCDNGRLHLYQQGALPEYQTGSSPYIEQDCSPLSMLCGENRISQWDEFHYLLVIANLGSTFHLRQECIQCCFQ